jgi:hypothetical protein
MNKYLLYAVPVVVIVGIALFVTGGTKPAAEQPADGTPATEESDVPAASSGDSTTLIPEGATTDADGFVRLPGEPSRGGSGYVLTSDTCEQFTVKFLEGITGKEILRTDPVVPGGGVCQYFVSATNANTMFQIAVQFLSVENQRTGQESLGRRVESNSRIPMDNFVVYQDDGKINAINLNINPNKFVSINRSSAKALTETEVLELAIKLAEKIRDFR